MKARRIWVCGECEEEIEVGDEIVMRTVEGGDRVAIHASHENLPKRHIKGYRFRWGSLRQSDPTIPNRHQGTYKRRGEWQPVIATMNGTRVYVGKALTPRERKQMLEDYYDRECQDPETCGHHCHVQRRRVKV